MSVANEYERYMLELINAERAKVGAPPLKLELNLNEAAEDHSSWMLNTDTFSHEGVGGSSPTIRIRDAGFDLAGSWRTAENIAIQSERGESGIMDDVENLHTSLMNSPGHRANILNANLEYIGIGIETGGFDFQSGSFDSVIVTQKFATTGGSVDPDNGTAAPAAPTTPAAPEPTPVEVAPPAADPDPVDTSENQTLKGTSAADKLYGGAGNDLMIGRGGNDRIDGGADNDKIYAGSGDDIITGASGDDRLVAGSGNDKLYGGGGNDIFEYRVGDDADIIFDFRNDVDGLDLTRLGYSSVNQALDDASRQGGNLVFDFGDGDTLTVNNITADQIADDILV